jgi:hypothetical protein
MLDRLCARRSPDAQKSVVGSFARSVLGNALLLIEFGDRLQIARAADHFSYADFSFLIRSVLTGSLPVCRLHNRNACLWRTA